jgi:hypothetical protein
MYAGRIFNKGFAKKRKRLLLNLRAGDRQGCGECLYSPSCRERCGSRKPKPQCPGPMGEEHQATSGIP